MNEILPSSSEVKFLIGKSASSESLNSTAHEQVSNNQQQQQGTETSLSGGHTDKFSDLSNGYKKPLSTTTNLLHHNESAPVIAHANSKCMTPNHLVHSISSSVIARGKLVRRLTDFKELSYVTSPEEFVQKYGGNRVINKVILLK